MTVLPGEGEGRGVRWGDVYGFKHVNLPRKEEEEGGGVRGEGVGQKMCRSGERRDGGRDDAGQRWRGDGFP